MTPRQAELMRFIQRRLTTTGVAPTFPEMAEAIGFGPRTKGPVMPLVDALEREGWIARERGRWRGIRVLKPLPDVLSAAEVAWCHDHAEAVRGLMERGAG